MIQWNSLVIKRKYLCEVLNVDYHYDFHKSDDWEYRYTILNKEILEDNRNTNIPFSFDNNPIKVYVHERDLTIHETIAEKKGIRY